MRRQFSSFALMVLLVAGLSACAYAPRYDGTPSYLNDYYYYPHVGVYFHLYSGDYYYRDGHSWVRVRVLPSRIYLDHRLRRTVVIPDAPPYRWHERHREEHALPPDFRRDRGHDRAERDHNYRRHLEYRERSRHAGPPQRVR